MGLFEKLKMNKNAKILEKGFPFYDDPNTATITCSHIIEYGKPILYVSHDVKSVRKLCDHAIWIDKGVVRKSGLVEEVTNEYMNE